MVFRAWGIRTPPGLSGPILQFPGGQTLPPPLGPISPNINGVVDSYFEWLGAGLYRVDQRSGAMHGKRALLREVRYGADESRVFLRIDFAEEPGGIEGLEIQAEVAGANGEPVRRLRGVLKS